MSTTTRLLLFQPRTSSGSALAFNLVEVGRGVALTALGDGIFRDHRTAVRVEVYEGDVLIATLDRPSDAVGQGQDVRKIAGQAPSL